MRFSTKSRYGLRLMAELACSTSGRAMPLKEISERQQLSLKYLEQLVTPLVRAGLVKSERGSQGESSPPWRGASPPSPASRPKPTPAPCRISAPPSPSGRGWTM